ncbi:MAG: radical SAM protein, partial [Chloroflexi bacterium]|nr:radical SAM protein [Chloroflexota bacterium]
RSVPSVAHSSDGLFVDGDHPTVTDMSMLPALDFGSYPIERYTHLHGYFGPWKPEGPAAQMELSRGCPYICTYCNRGTFRHAYRHRPLEKIAAEMETLKRRGVQYVYFVDEMFGLGVSRQVLRGIAERPLFRFGIQSRLDTWNEEGLDLLARAGCIAVEFGLESPIFDSIRPFNKRYRFSPERALSLLSYAKGRIDWVQVNLVRPPDQPQAQREEVAQWRGRMIDEGIWVSEPVPLYPYPGSEWHEQLFGPIDAHSWERAHDYYLGRYERWTSLQDCSPSPLDELEHGGEGSLCTF